MSKAMGDGEISAKVVQYEDFLNERLKKDLKKILDERDKVYSEEAEYLQLKNVIEKIQETNLVEEGIRTKIDLGCNFYVQAKVPDVSYIYVCVGYGFYVQFTLPEALRFIEKKSRQLTEQSDQLTRDAAKVKAHIKLVLQGLKEMQGFGDEPVETR